MLIYVFLFAAGLTAWLTYKPGWMPTPPDVHLPALPADQREWLKSRFEDGRQLIRSFRKSRAGRGLEFRAWAGVMEQDESTGLPSMELQELKEFKAWIRTLDDQNMDVIAGEIEIFFERQGIDMDWLAGKSEPKDMQKALSTLVAYYGLALRQRMSMRPIAALSAWEKDPLSGKNREFGSRLYQLIASQGRLTLPPAILLAPEKERMAHVISMIQTELARDRSAVVSLAALAIDPQRFGTHSHPNNAESGGPHEN